MKNDSTIAENALDFPTLKQHPLYVEVKETSKTDQDTYKVTLDSERRLQRAIDAARCIV